MKTKYFLLVLALLSATCLCHAQEELPTVVADRPGNTDGSDVMPLHKIGWDNGFHFESVGDGSHSFTLNSTMLRYGIFENVELRIGTEFLLLNDADPTRLGIAPLTIGTKIKLYESDSFLPSISVRADFMSPHIGTKELLSAHIGPSLNLIFEHSIADRFWLCYNAGMDWDGETAEPEKFLAIAFGGDITEALGAYLETYHYLHSEDNQHMMELGLTWLASRRVQLDIEADFDLMDFGQHYGVGFGVAWLIN